MPAGSLGHTRDDGAVIAPADHDARVETCIILKMADGGKELLVPSTEQDRTSIANMRQPVPFIFYAHLKSPRVGPDKPVYKRHEQFRFEQMFRFEIQRPPSFKHLISY